MQKDDFIKLKLKFAQTDLAGKIAIYTETPDLSRDAAGAREGLSARDGCTRSD